MGAVDLYSTGSLPLRTNWLMVGIQMFPPKNILNLLYKSIPLQPNSEDIVLFSCAFRRKNAVFGGVSHKTPPNR
jgi:hypothetical protein